MPRPERSAPKNNKWCSSCSKPDLILRPVKIVNVFIESNASWLPVLNSERMRHHSVCQNLSLVSVNVRNQGENTSVFCVAVACLWMSIHGWSGLVATGIVSESVATGHGGLVENACVLCWQSGVLGPEKVNWQICTHSSVSILPHSP